MVNNYKKIMKVTQRLMSEKGYHGTSIQMIAAKIGITKSTIIHHFKNKEGLLLAILEAYVPPATERFFEIVKDENISGTEKLKKFFRFHLKEAIKNKDVFSLYIHESRYFGEHNRKVFLKTKQAYTGMVAQIVRQVQMENKQVFKELEPKVIANAILGMINYTIYWYAKGGKLNIDSIADHYYQIVMGRFDFKTVPDILKPH